MAKAALDKAIDFAGQPDGWEITVVCGEDRPADWSGQSFKGFGVNMDVWLKDWRAEVAADMEEAVERVRKAGIPVASACTQEQPVDLLLNVAHEIGAELIVVGAKGGGTVHDVVLGRTATRLLHHSDIPVVVVPPTR
jgi:nucleotide-binding universal stress UspA family protein